MLVREPVDDKHFDLALEISSTLRGKEIKLSADAEEILYIEQSRFRSTFIKLMLFVDSTPELIGKCIDMKEELIIAYRELFFDMSLIRGQLGKTEYYEDAFYAHAEGTSDYAFAKLLEEAHLGGKEVVMAQFNITIDDYSVAGYKERTSQIAMWREKIVDRTTQDYQALTIEAKAKDAILSVVTKAASKDDKAKMSDLGALVKILEHMNGEGMGREDKEVRSYNVDTEEVYEAEYDALPEPVPDPGLIEIPDFNKITKESI